MNAKVCYQDIQKTGGRNFGFSVGKRYLDWKKNPSETNLGSNLLVVGGFEKTTEDHEFPDMQHQLLPVEVLDHGRKVTPNDLSTPNSNFTFSHHYVGHSVRMSRVYDLNPKEPSRYQTQILSIHQKSTQIIFPFIKI